MILNTALLIVLAVVLATLTAMTAWYANGWRKARLELRRARDEGAEAKEELVGAARLVSLGTLLAGVTHEISTPLGAIRSNRDMLRRVVDKLEAVLADGRVTDDEIPTVTKLAGAISGIVEVDELALERITGQVRTLRTFGCGEAEEPERYDLNRALGDAVTLLRHKIKNRIAVETELGAIPEIECYPARINQVLLNVLLNACQALEGKGTIWIRSREADGEVYVEIEDTGTGIPEEVIDRLFKPGFTTKSEGLGMGLGLPISRQIVEEHGGRMEVRSRPGEGSTFTVVLPVELDREASVDSREAAESQEATESLEAAQSPE